MIIASDQRRLDLSQGFSAGNYCNAYETRDFSSAVVKRQIKDKSTAYATAFILGFFASYENHEIPGEHQDAVREAYYSDDGKIVLELGYTEPREESWE